MKPETTSLDQATTVTLSEHNRRGRPVFFHLIPAGGQLIVSELFGHKLDRRRNQPKPVPGAYFVIDPATARIVGHRLPAVHLARLVPSPDGLHLYGAQPGPPDLKGRERLLKIMATTGEAVGERTLEVDVWSITLASLPESLISGGKTQTEVCAPVGSNSP